MNSKIKELEEKVKFYEYIFDNINAGIWVNRYDRNLWLNKKIREISGHTTEEINKIGMEEYGKQFYHPDDSAMFEESYKYLCDNNIGHATYIFRTKDKNGKWIKTLGTTQVSKRLPNGFPEESVNCGIIISEKLSCYTQIESLIKENAYLKNKLKLKYLTKRELEILKLITNGSSTKQIAEKENISFHTVETHRKKIMKKLQINNLACLVRLATECGAY